VRKQIDTSLRYTHFLSYRDSDARLNRENLASRLISDPRRSSTIQQRGIARQREDIISLRAAEESDWLFEILT